MSARELWVTFYEDGRPAQAFFERPDPMPCWASQSIRYELPSSDGGEREALLNVERAARELDELFRGDVQAWTLGEDSIADSDVTDALLSLHDFLNDATNARAATSSSPPAGGETGEAALLRAELAWYADEDNYEWARGLPNGRVQKDRGARARAALVSTRSRPDSMRDALARLWGAVVDAHTALGRGDSPLDVLTRLDRIADDAREALDASGPAGGEGDKPNDPENDLAVSIAGRLIGSDPDWEWSEAGEFAQEVIALVREHDRSVSPDREGEGCREFPDGYVPLSIREAGGAALDAWRRGASYEEARALIPRVDVPDEEGDGDGA